MYSKGSLRVNESFDALSFTWSVKVLLVLRFDGSCYRFAYCYYNYANRASWLGFLFIVEYSMVLSIRICRLICNFRLEWLSIRYRFGIDFFIFRIDFVHWINIEMVWALKLITSNKSKVKGWLMKAILANALILRVAGKLCESRESFDENITKIYLKFTYFLYFYSTAYFQATRSFLDINFS